MTEELEPEIDFAPGTIFYLNPLLQGTLSFIIFFTALP